jgi:hypothetical protein
VENRRQSSRLEQIQRMSSIHYAILLIIFE